MCVHLLAEFNVYMSAALPYLYPLSLYANNVMATAKKALLIVETTYHMAYIIKERLLRRVQVIYYFSILERGNEGEMHQVQCG
jgi:hypothetical protein